MSKVSLFSLTYNADGTTSCIQASEKTLIVLTDHHGNIFFKHENMHYLLFLDSSRKEGAYVIKVPKIDIFKRIYEDSWYASSKHTVGGKITATGETLKGKVATKLNELDQDEKDNFIENNEYTIQPTPVGESNYYWVSRDKNTQDELDYDDDPDNPDINGFYLDSISRSEDDKFGIVLAELLCEYPCSFKTVLVEGGINSHNVSSAVQQKSGFSTQDATIYTNGFIKSNFVDTEKCCRLCIDDNDVVSTHCM
jgi:hypothetical protein